MPTTRTSLARRSPGGTETARVSRPTSCGSVSRSRRSSRDSTPSKRGRWSRSRRAVGHWPCSLRRRSGSGSTGRRTSAPCPRRASSSLASAARARPATAGSSCSWRPRSPDPVRACVRRCSAVPAPSATVVRGSPSREATATPDTWTSALRDTMRSRAPGSRSVPRSPSPSGRAESACGATVASSPGVLASSRTRKGSGAVRPPATRAAACRLARWLGNSDDATDRQRLIGAQLGCSETVDLIHSSRGALITSSIDLIVRLKSHY